MIELWASAPAPPTATDMWGSAIPAWLGAIGSIAASVVAMIALIREVSTRRGLKQTIAPAADEPLAQLGPERSEIATTQRAGDEHGDGHVSVEDRPDGIRGAEDDGWGDAGKALPTHEPMLRRSGLRVERVDRRRYDLVNVLDLPIAVLELRQAEDGDDVLVRRELPAALQPGETLRLVVERSLASPAVIALDVTYGTRDWSSRRRLYLD